MRAAWRRALHLAVTAWLLLSACGERDVGGKEGADAEVQWWLTTGDSSQLLAAQPPQPLVAGAVLPESDATAGRSVTLVVDTAQRFQVMQGFGAALTDASAWLLQHRLTSEQRRALLHELFGRDRGGIGLSAVRITLGASDFSRMHYTYDDVPTGQRDDSLVRFTIAPARDAVIPLLREARAIDPSLVVVAAPWSAPAWMKTSASLAGGTLRRDAYDAYARYLWRTLEAFDREGIPIDYLSVQNEPHHEPADYPGMRLDPPQRAALIGQHVGPLFASRNTRTRLLEWDHNWDAPESPLAVLADATARRYVHGVAWHCYAGDVAAQSRVHEAHPGLETWFTECAGGDWAPDFGGNLRWNVATLVIGATRHWARGVLLWNLALSERHGPHLGGCGNCRGVITIDSATGSVARNEEFYALAHASRFVRPGAVRVASTSGADSVHSVAFHHHDRTLVLVAVNLAGAPRRLRVQSGERGFAAALPAGAVATFTWR
jgi:glucosylceramidase